MSDTVTHKPPPRIAADLRPGDRIAAEFLPSRYPAIVEFATTYRGARDREDWALVTYRYADGGADADHFLARAMIPLDAVADDIGHGYSREADDPTPVSPARVPLHAGGLDGTAAPTTVQAGDGDELIVDGCV